MTKTIIITIVIVITITKITKKYSSQETKPAEITNQYSTQKTKQKHYNIQKQYTTYNTVLNNTVPKQDDNKKTILKNKKIQY